MFLFRKGLSMEAKSIYQSFGLKEVVQVGYGLEIVIQLIKNKNNLCKIKLLDSFTEKTKK